MRIAITREVPPTLAHCELSHQSRVPIDIALAKQQHATYQQALRDLGVEVRTLPAEPAFPDSVFVEDPALVLDEVAVILRPGAESRRGETESIARALAPERDLLQVLAPATVDGGDVLRLGKRLYVGLSQRSTSQAVAQLNELLAPYGYEVEGVPLTACLHLKSAVTEVAPGTLLANPAFVDVARFAAQRVVQVHPEEPAGANALRVGDTAIYSKSYPRTRERLEAAGIRILPVDASEVEKAEGAVTCCSLVFEGR